MTDLAGGDSRELAGQVAIITGAGRGIGRADALLLARRGAAVVVNDIGAAVTGEGTDQSVTEAVVEEIVAGGGRAVANSGDVSTAAGGQSAVDAALEAFGRVDILVHNAGVLRKNWFGELALEDVAAVLDTHLLGAFHVGQPAWREMRRRGYGRMVLTTSVAMFGAPQLSAYAAAKAGVVGLVRTLALEASDADVDIKVNAISPTAATRGAGWSHRSDQAAASLDSAVGGGGSPDNVAAVTALLVSPGCPVTGTCVRAGGSHVARIYTGISPGWTPGDQLLTTDEVAGHFQEVMLLPGEESLILPASSADARRITVERVRAASTGAH